MKYTQQTVSNVCLKRILPEEVLLKAHEMLENHESV
jgi:hypothetical protein